MKKRSTGKRLLAFVCALVMVLGVGLQANVMTARAYDYVLEGYWDEAAGEYVVTKTTTSYEGFEASERRYWEGIAASQKAYKEELLAQGIDDVDVWIPTDEEIEEMLAQTRQFYIEHGILVIEKPTPYTPEQRVMNAAKQQLKEPKAATDSNKNKIISLGGYCALSNKMMKQLADTVSKGYNVAFQYKYEGKNYVVLIPAGAEVDTELEWAGPLYLASKYLDITDAYYAQSKKICPELRLQNVINGVVE